MIEYIKRWFFYRDFKPDTSLKRSSGKPINALNNIGILFNGTEENDRRILHKFKKSLIVNPNKSVKSLAFVSNHLPLDNVDYAAYNLKNVKWYGVPFGQKVEEFINNKFDILIVLCEKMLPHYEYIVAHSLATFIAGPNLDKSQTYFQFIIDIDGIFDLQSTIDVITESINKIAEK